MAKIKRNDQVLVIAGKDKGKRGRVLRVITDKNRVLVEGVSLIKKHVKPNPQTGKQGGIETREAAIAISNVMLLGSDGQVTRVGYRMEGDRKIRVARSTNTDIAEPGR